MLLFPWPWFLALWRCALRGSLWVGLCLASATPAWAQAPAEPAWFRLGGLSGVQARFAVLPDPHETLDWPQVQAPGLFQPIAPGPQPVFSGSGVWLRIQLTVPPHRLGETAWLRVVPALIWHLEWHDDLGRSGLAGMSVPLYAQQHPVAPSIIQVPLDRSHITLHLRVLSAAPQLTHLSLLSTAELQQEVQQHTAVRALFLGAVGLMLALTLLNWAYTRAPLYRDFALYLSATVLFMLCVEGDINTHLLTDQPEWMARLSFASFMWAIAATLVFSLSALSLPQRMPAWAARLRVLAGAVFLASALGLQGHWIAPVAAVMWPFHLGLGLLLLGVSLHQVWRLRTAQSAVVFLAYLGFNLFEKFPFMTMLGWFPLSAWTSDVAKLGLLCQMLLTQLQWAMQLREQQALERRALAADLDARAERSQRHDLLQFLGMFGHEVRTPLAIIHAATESLEMLPGAELPANQLRHQRIRAAVERLTALAREALSRERIEAGGWQPLCRPVDLPQLVEDLLWLQEAGAPQPGASPPGAPQRHPWPVGGQPGGHLSVQLAPPLPPLHADPDMLHMALGNLLDNARKYAAPGSEVRLCIACPAPQGHQPPHCTIDISSQGTELTETERQRMFDKYWRRDEHRNLPGAGLGLHLVRTLIHAHAGHITVHSLPGRWTCFRITLPLRPPQPGQHSTTAATDTNANANAGATA